MGREASFGGGVFEASVVFFSVGCLFERREDFRLEDACPLFINLNHWNEVSISIPFGINPCVGVVQASCFSVSV